MSASASRMTPLLSPSASMGVGSRPCWVWPQNPATGRRLAAATLSVRSTSTCPYPGWHRRCTCRSWRDSRRGRGFRTSVALACLATASFPPTSRSATQKRRYPEGGGLPEPRGEGWERDDSVRRTIVFPGNLAERLAAEAGRRGISLSDLLVEYAEQGLRQAR